jgi:hypothetical protein
MFLRIALLCCLGMGQQGNAHELHAAARGLSVEIEDLDGVTGVNGVPLGISRAVGSDVPMLADRIIRKWNIDSGKDSVRLIHCCGWAIASRIHTRDSQVIQWRRTDAGDELIWSATRLAASVPAVPRITVPLPSDCARGTPTHGVIAGRRFLQLSAHCSLDTPAIVTLLVRRMSSEGWQLQRRSPALIQAQRGRVQAQLIASPAVHGAGIPDVGRSTLVLVESRPAGEADP